jgi:hypothetical protein
MQGHLLLIQEDGLNVNVSSLHSGLYQIRLTTQNGYVVKTISKIK